MTAPVLADELGPRGRRFVRVATAVSLVALGLVVLVALARLNARNQLNADLWRPFTDPSVLRFLWEGLLNTLKAAAISMVLAMAIAAVLALARLARTPLIRWPAGLYVQFFRAVPLLLLILFSALGLPKYGIALDPLWYLVLGLVAYNSAVLAEIFRAGILSLDRGQTEAASAIGLRYWQSMRLVIVPQALRRMIPAIVSQLITLLKDSSLGYVVPYAELLRHGRITGEFYRNPLQALFVVALVYIAVNLVLSRIARRLEVRQRRRYGASGIQVAGAGEDLAVVEASASAESNKGS